jgi:uncharacterized membrane protein
VSNDKRKNPLIWSGIMMGAGLGGFVDGIVFHQILQWHNMLSARIPPDNLVAVKINMTWDGYFHALVWVMTVIGLFMFWQTATKHKILGLGRVFLGSLILGWGVFNLIEGIIDHLILNIHHLNEFTPNKFIYDLGFLLSGSVLILVGWWLTRKEYESV